MKVRLPLSGETMERHFGLVRGGLLGRDTHLGGLLAPNWVKTGVSRCILLVWVGRRSAIWTRMEGGYKGGEEKLKV